MSFSKFVGRSLLSSMFVVGGVNQFRNADKLAGAVDAAEELLPSSVVGPLNSVNSTLLVKIDGAAMTAAGIGVALGIAPRFSAAVLATQMVPVTLAGHRFWEKEGDERRSHWIHFLKNTSLAGGLLLVALSGKQK